MFSRTVWPRRTVLLNSGSKRFRPDALVYHQGQDRSRPEIPIAIIEVENEIGVGDSDPIAQAQSDYLAFYSSDEVSHCEQHVHAY